MLSERIMNSGLKLTSELSKRTEGHGFPLATMCVTLSYREKDLTGFITIPLQ